MLIEPSEPLSATSSRNGLGIGIIMLCSVVSEMLERMKFECNHPRNRTTVEQCCLVPESQPTRSSILSVTSTFINVLWRSIPRQMAMKNFQAGFRSSIREVSLTVPLSHHL